MNVFLDSNILFEDYFFNNSNNKKLLGYCEKGMISLYMSEIVVLELRKQFIDELEEKNRHLGSVKKDALRLKIEKEILLIDLPEQLVKFDAFYKKMESIDKFEVIKYKNEYLPDIVDRAIYKKKPFTQEKLELKDALIWKTYSDFVELNSLDTCILLTGNHSDFCDSKDHSIVHPELLKDTKRFKVIKNSFEFIRQNASVLESPQHKLRVFLERTQIDDTYVNELVHQYFNKILAQRLLERIEKLTPNDVMDDEFWHDGYVSQGRIDLLDCYDTEHEELTDTVLVSGKIKAYCDLEVFEYNGGKDHGEDLYDGIEEKTVTFEIYFNFNLSPEEKATDFDIIDIRLLE